jgi:sulfoxide reductase heme-binding subunit YedZ
MTRLYFTTRILKPILFLAALYPAGWLIWAALTTHLGADPIKKIQVVTGTATLTILLVTLSVTPVRRLTRWNGVIRLRRMSGLFAFFYVCLHAITYFVFDQSLSLSLIWADTVEHPRIAVGFAAFVLLIPLAITSTDRMIRRLGRRWGQLHRAVYVAATLGVIHYLWVVKRDVRQPLTYAWILLALLVLRVWFRWEKERSARRPSRVMGGVEAGTAPG